MSKDTFSIGVKEYMNITSFSKHFDVRFMNSSDIDQIYELSEGNTMYYDFHPPFVTKESIAEDMRALPPGVTYEAKYYVGYFNGNDLVAILDLITGWPEETTVMIGLFMVDSRYQGKGTGTAIIDELIPVLGNNGFQKARIGVDRGNPQSYAFWKKNQFTTVSQNTYMVMERNI